MSPTIEPFELKELKNLARLAYEKNENIKSDNPISKGFKSAYYLSMIRILSDLVDKLDGNDKRFNDTVQTLKDYTP